METPRYEFSEKKMKENYKYISSKLPMCRMFYAMKANGDEKVLYIIKKMGLGFECASTYEFERVRRQGVSPSDIIFGLPVKTIETIEYTYKNGCRYYVFDDIRELRKLQRYAPESKKILRVKISDIVTSSIILGMPMIEIEQYFKEIKESIDGVSFHISYNNNIADAQKVFDRLNKIMQRLEYKNKKYIVNVGGGYESETSEEFYESYNLLLYNFQKKYNCTLYAEPGKIIIGSAGSFYAKAISIRHIDNKFVVYLDGGIANGLGYSTFLGDVVNCGSHNKQSRKLKIYEFRDCTNLNETLVQTESVCEIEVGDVIRFSNLGAYSLAFQNEFHKWRKCRVDIVK